MKTVLKMGSMRQLLVVPAAALLVSGCGGLAEDYCDARCECEVCNERQADECLIVGTTTEITPVAQINNWKVKDGKPGPITKILQQAFRKLIRNIA